MVSLRDSPLEELEVAASEKPMTRPPQAIDRSLKAQSGTSWRLKEKGGDDSSLEKLAVGVLLKESSSIKESKNILRSELVDRY